MTATGYAKPGRPAAGEYAPFYADYVALALDDDIVAALTLQVDDMRALLVGVSEAVANTRHAPYTWSVKQVVGHMSDADRAFGGRAHRFARYDPTPLPGFDEQEYMKHSPFDAQPLADLLDEFCLVRQSNVAMFRSLIAPAWQQVGIANGTAVSVRALAYILVGHARHHIGILRKRLNREG